MAVVAELMHLGLLSKEAYKECVGKFISQEGIDVRTCEILATLIEAWDHESYFSTTADESLEKTYLNLLQDYLFPQLTAIIGNVEVEFPNSFEHFNAVKRQTVLGNVKEPPPILNANSKTISRNPNRLAKFNLDFEQKTVEINELILAPKIVDLITILLRKFLVLNAREISSKFETFSEGPYLSVQRVYSLIGEVFDLVGKNLLECRSESFSKCGQHRAKFLSLIFTNFVMEKDWLYSDSNCLRLRQQVTSVNEAALTMIQSSHDTDTTALLLNLIVHPFIATFPEERSSVILSLWGIIQNFYVIKECFVMEETNSTGFLVLCFMAEYIFDLDSLCEVRNDDRFYTVIQFGLMHIDTLTRKRSQFILKRAVDFCFSSESGHICCNNFSWKDADKSSLENSWNNFFLMYETLEEKQSHVIWPVLDKLEKFIDVISKRIVHVSWMLVIFKRVFDHDNKSIRFWGVMKMLKLKPSDFMLRNGVITFVNCHLLAVLGDYSLYGQEADQSHHEVNSTVGEEFGNFLLSTVCTVDCGYLKYFMHSILESIFDGRTWGGIPLFYVMRGLSLIPSTHLWEYGMVKNALVKFEGCLSTQEVALRSASQCGLLRAMLKHLNQETSLIELCSAMRHFRRRECWCRGTIMWKLLIESVDTFERSYESTSGLSSVEDALIRSLNSGIQEDSVVPSQDVALGICLLLEKLMDMNCETERKSRIECLLLPISTFLVDCHLRPYLNQQKFVWVLSLLYQLLEICNDVPEKSAESKDITGVCLSWMNDNFACVIQLFAIHVRGFNHLRDMEMMSLYLNLFSQLHQAPALAPVIDSQNVDIFLLCQELLNDESNVKHSYGIVLLEYLLRYSFDQSAVDTKQAITKLTICKIICNVEEITRKRPMEGYTSAKSSAKFQLEVTRSCWSCMELLVKKTSSWTSGKLLLLREDIETKTLSILTEAISIAARVNVLSVFKTCVELAHVIIREGMWHTVIDLLWVSSLEFKKCCDVYRSLMKCLSDLLFHHDALIEKDCSDSLDKISQNLLNAAESVEGIAGYMSRSLIQSLCVIMKDDRLSIGACESAIDMLLALARFGAVFRKQQRIIKDTTTYIYNCPDLYSTNLLLEGVESDQQARAVVIRLFLSLRKDRSQDRALAGALFKRLKSHYDRCSGDRRDFANSQNHRYKTRLLQVFMVLLPLLSEVECGVAVEWLCCGLMKEHQQPSVRYMQEWGISIIIIYHQVLFPRFFELFMQGTKERIGCVGSFLASLTHIACTSEEDAVVCRTIQYTLPWCMAQHFNTRLYAQVSLRKIWNHCENKNMTETLSQYGAVQHCLQFVAEQGNAVRNTHNMLNDFYFKVFHPIQHYTLKTIFYDLPCLSLLADDEWLAVGSLLNVVDLSILPVNSELPLDNPDNALSEAEPAPWVVKAAGETSLMEDQDGGTDRFVVQKKMTPWKSMMPELVCSLGLPHQKSPNQKRGGLIVVASLIDKAPNLGGLCRTCEVFSVKEYIVPSLSVQEDHNFNSLSLTAQQWVPMKEVKPENLPVYLRSLQSEGYTLVAAEQTANSKLLSEFEFPEMTVVILGNEREGIPCDLLQLLDVCVEIPQTGIIRSLNVHVSGALFVWEYTRQHLGKLMKA